MSLTSSHCYLLGTASLLRGSSNAGCPDNKAMGYGGYEGHASPPTLYSFYGQNEYPYPICPS